MKAFLVFLLIGLVLAFVWFMFFKYDILNQEAPILSSISENEPIETSQIFEEIELEEEPSNESVETESVDDSENVIEPNNRATPAGSIIPRGDYLYYKKSQYIIKTKLITVEVASSELASRVKTDIPESTQYSIWLVKFEQALHNGIQVYGSSSGLEMFNVTNVEGDREAYILNSSGDYPDCPSTYLFGKDFSEDYVPYMQCFVVASNSEPVLLFTGEQNSEFISNPIIFK